MLVSFGIGGDKAEIWDLEKGELKKTLVNGTTSGSCNFSSNLKHVVCNAADIKIYLYNIDGISSIETNNEIQATITYPNPSSTELVLEFNLTNPNHTTITINDLNGKQIKEVFNGYMNEGNHKLNIDLRELQNGNYFLRIQSGNSIYTNKISVIK